MSRGCSEYPVTVGVANGFGDEQDRAQVGQLAQQVQAVTGHTVEIAFVDQDYTGEQAAEAVLPVIMSACLRP